MVGWMYCVVDTNYTKPALTDIFSLLIPQAFGFPTISQKSGEKLVRFPNPLASQSQFLCNLHHIGRFIVSVFDLGFIALLPLRLRQVLKGRCAGVISIISQLEIFGRHKTHNKVLTKRQLKLCN